MSKRPWIIAGATFASATGAREEKDQTHDPTHSESPVALDPAPHERRGRTDLEGGCARARVHDERRAYARRASSGPCCHRCYFPGAALCSVQRLHGSLYYLPRLARDGHRRGSAFRAAAAAELT